MEKSEEVFSNTIDVQPTPPLSATASLECVTPPQTPTPITPSEKVQSLQAPNQRLRYDRQELLRIRDSSSAFPIPQLPNLDIIVSNLNNRRENPRSSYPTYTGTNSQGRGNPQYHRQSSSSTHASLTRYPNSSSTASSDSRRKPGIYLANEPDFSNRSENPYKPPDQAKLDANNKVLRDCKAILNKVTPQTFEKLQKQLEGLEIDRYERLEGMITIFFSKVNLFFAISSTSKISSSRQSMNQHLVFSTPNCVNNFKKFVIILCSYLLIDLILLLLETSNSPG